MTNRFTRRQTLKLIGAGLASACLTPHLVIAKPSAQYQKPISGNKKLPVIGLGTWRTFNVGNDKELLDARTQVVKAFFANGGGLIDSSPMYGSAADVMGYALQRLGKPKTLFAAEKVWSPAGGSTAEQVAEQAERWGVQHFDLMQIHNLADWREHLETLQQMKADGKIRYVGITTSHGRRHYDIEQVMKSEDIDFVQLTYNITHRAVEDRLLPVAKERNIAVIANRPYDGGNLIKQLKRRNQKVPEWAAKECACTNWADFLLKFIVSHPAVTCAIPATTRVDHLNENMKAGREPMPSSAVRQRMIKYIESL